jgi:hypothetical protein
MENVVVLGVRKIKSVRRLLHLFFREQGTQHVDANGQIKTSFLGFRNGAPMCCRRFRKLDFSRRNSLHAK